MRTTANTLPSVWPKDRGLAISVSVMLEGWTDDSAPGLGPMGNPLRAGVQDTQARSWAEYGPKTGAWRLLDLMADEDVKGVFYTSGILAERYPDLMKAIVESGHTIAAHAWAQNIIPAYQTREEETSDLQRSIAAIAKFSGAEPKGWISPRATPSANTPDVLAEGGMEWFADAFDQDLPYLVETSHTPIVAIPFTVEVNDVPLYVRYGNLPAAFPEILKDILAGWPLIRSPLGCLDLTAHAHVFGRPAGAIAFRQAIQIAKQCSFGWMTSHAELASACLSSAKP